MKHCRLRSYQTKLMGVHYTLITYILRRQICCTKWVTYIQGSFNNYVDRILPFFTPKSAKYTTLMYIGIYASRNVCVKDIDSRASMVLQNYQKILEMTSNMIKIVGLGVGFKCPRKIHLKTQCPAGVFKKSQIVKSIRSKNKNF